MSKDVESIILAQLEDLHRQIRGIRTEDIPRLQIKMAVIEERASKAAKVTAAVISLIGLAVSIAAAYLR